MNKTEGFMPFKGYKTWYVVYGKEHNRIPLFVLHGGPGYPHNFQNNLAGLADNGYPVIMYDQLGCGLSDWPKDTSLWTVSLYVEELEALRKHLGFENINIIGQSWGSSLAIEYTLKYPERVNKLILHSPLIDTKLWVEEADKLKDQLPDGLGIRMRELEQTGDTKGEEYKKLSDLFNDTFVLRVKPKPQDAIDGEDNASSEVYNTMWGPSEAYATGNLKNWSVIDKLPNIKQKTLLISGKYDEATPKQMTIIKDNISDLTWELFKNSSHCANLEEPKKFMEVVTGFLS
jgi:proline-specific peptidase